jgi:tetratricopeptide (TPR) repeat protein
MKRALACAAALWLASVSFARPGAAQTPAELERAKASFKAGANAYAAGDYLAAIQALEDAYDLTPLPAIAFSLAQAERKQYGVKKQREHLERALQLFRRYLQQEPNGARRGDAQLAIADLQPQLGGAPSAETASKAQARPTRLMIVSETPGARISLDGGPVSGSPLIREVAPGKHRAHVEARGYVSVEREVTAVAGELLSNEVRLNESPTSLYVWAPFGADIYVDGVYYAQGGGPTTIALPSGRHQLAVTQVGRRVVLRDIQLERGRTHTEYVTLEPTMQRSLSELLFIGGGAAVGASLILSAFAVRSQNNAEAILSASHHRRIENAERIAYNASLVERNRYRTAAGIGVAGSLGLFITGLFLHELDRPSLPVGLRRESEPSRQATLASPRLVFSPVAPSSDVGASLQLHF